MVAPEEFADAPRYGVGDRVRNRWTGLEGVIEERHYICVGSGEWMPMVFWWVGWVGPSGRVLRAFAWEGDMELLVEAAA